GVPSGGRKCGPKTFAKRGSLPRDGWRLVVGKNDSFQPPTTKPESPVDLTALDLPLTDPRHPFHVQHMELALAQAELAAADGEVPVGAVIVSLERGLIAQAHNQRERLVDPTAHAEMIALTQAAQALGSWRLENCVLFVTLEPCPMCAGAVVQARLPLVGYGWADPNAGACDTRYRIARDP